MAGPLYFAWCAQGALWDTSMLREDEKIFAVEITQTEGDFATLKIDLENPRVGLLAAGRNLWCYLSYGTDPLGLAFPIFHGRLIGVPENLQDEVVRLEFVAKPPKYKALKTELANEMKSGSFFDPVWLKDKADDPDTILETYSSLWHIDRVTVQVTASDFLQGEAGTIEVGPDQHFYDAMTVTYGQTPLTQVEVKGTVTWDQTGDGAGVDLTPALVKAFVASGSPFATPLIASLTADGLLSSWPKPGSNIGGGWSVGVDSSIEKATWIKTKYYRKTYTDYDPEPEATSTTDTDPDTGEDNTNWAYPSGWEYPTDYAKTWARPTAFNIQTGIWGPRTTATVKTWAVVFPLHVLSARFSIDWKASRKRSEVVKFTLRADLQPLVTDPDDEDILKLEYTASNTITDEIDPGDVKPLEDTRRNSYFLTTRGARSFEYLVLLARAKLLARARCVKIKFTCSFDLVVGWISCRHSVRLLDPRLPGGDATGKITGYVLVYSSDKVQAEVTIGCTIGRGGLISPSSGTPGYADSSYVGADYQAFVDQNVELPTGDITYLGFGNYTVTDDDGVDLFNMDADSALLPTVAVNLSTTGSVRNNSTALISLADTTDLVDGVIYDISSVDIPVGATMTYNGSGAGTLSVPALITNTLSYVTLTGAASDGILVIDGITDQTSKIDEAAKARVNPDPVKALKNAATKICLNLNPVSGVSFESTFDMHLSALRVPLTIDLESA